jgi:hypothetical protein
MIFGTFYLGPWVGEMSQIAQNKGMEAFTDSLYLVFERKLTHLLRCFTKLKSSRTTVRSGFSFARALHLGKFSSKHGFSVTHYLSTRYKVLTFGTLQTSTVIFAVFISTLKPWKKKK